jgi:citrate lyase beta subunit
LPDRPAVPDVSVPTAGSDPRAGAAARPDPIRGGGRRPDRIRAAELGGRFLLQRAHLTTPATVWKYVEGAVTRSPADLVMLDLEDSTPRGNDALLQEGRRNVVRALLELDWGQRLRFFRPRGQELDPGLDDVVAVVAAAGHRLDGLVYPKVDHPWEVVQLDQELGRLEGQLGLSEGKIRLQILIESVLAEEQAFAIAGASPRISGLVFGAFDYWSSLGMRGVPYRSDHPLVMAARGRIVRAAASVGVPAIAEMTLNFPTRDKPAEAQRQALEECRSDALLARELGFQGKWVGIPAQAEIAREVFTLSRVEIDAALAGARAFLAAERAGRGAAIIDGQMADRATDRMNRVVLRTALQLGQLERPTAHEVGLIEDEGGA